MTTQPGKVRSQIIKKKEKEEQPPPRRSYDEVIYFSRASCPGTQKRGRETGGEKRLE